ncbi:MAG: ParB/RepB/Spo0J family partition protein [Candidatus Dactylopiibacterium sp.]|nr:ParB/RepB/Spo0J family partition protein [Candidatus Dactylopiibacterium sp.]
MLPLHCLQRSPTNPRKHFATPDWDEFVASIAKHGVMQPILARPWPTGRAGRDVGTEYEIVAGERRWRGSLAAERQEIPVMVRDLTDREVLELQIIENLQRRNISELEEAEGYQRMTNEVGYSVDELCEAVGKSRAYIYARLKLLDLCEEARDPLVRGVVPASVALLVARMPTPSLQKRAMTEIAAGWTTMGATGEPMSARAAARHIQERYTLQIKSAPWPLDDATLIPLAGACDACPLRTGCNREMFADITADVCTSPDCFQAKRARWPQVKVERAIAAGFTVIQGEEAQRLAPRGWLSPYAQDDVPEEQKLVELDDDLGDDEDSPTIRDVLGAHLETLQRTVIITTGHESIEVITAGALQKALTDIGYKPPSHDAAPAHDHNASQLDSPRNDAWREQYAKQKALQEARAESDALCKRLTENFRQWQNIEPTELGVRLELLAKISILAFGPNDHDDYAAILGIDPAPQNCADTVIPRLLAATEHATREQLLAVVALEILFEASRLPVAPVHEPVAREVLRPYLSILEGSPDAPESLSPPTQAARAGDVDARDEAAQAPDENPAEEPAPAPEEAPEPKPKAPPKQAKKNQAATAAKDTKKGKESGRAAAGGNKKPSPEATPSPKAKLAPAAKKPAAASKKPVHPPVKYRNPALPTQTWTGRGKKPAWVETALAEGRTLADLEISQ